MKSKAGILSFIEINHHLMTMNEMADELGIHYNTITRICKENNWKAVSEKERQEGLEVTTPMKPEEIPGLIEVAALIARDMTPKERERFGRKLFDDKLR